MTTILDVARRAKVSTATVSRVLSQPSLVRQETRDRVMRIVRELEYEPNPAARTLRTLRSSKLLLSVPDISNTFFSNVIRGAEQAAREAGYAVILGDTGNQKQWEDQYAAMLGRREVDGLVLLGHRIPEVLRAEILKRPGRAPIVNACEYSEGLGVSSVHIDNVAAGEDAVRYLTSLNHRAIGVITGPLDSPLSRDRLQGAQRAMSKAEPGVGVIVRPGDFSVESGLHEGRELLGQKVSAIFCFSDEMAMGVLEAVRERGLRCPEDVSVIGFDDIRFARHLAPSLTTIAQPSAEIGRRALDLLIRTISGELQNLEVVTLPHALVVRNSTALASSRT